MRNDSGSQDDAGRDRLRSLGTAARRWLIEAGPLARLALAGGVLGVLALGVLLARQPVPTAGAWLYEGRRFPPDDAARLVRALATKGIAAQAVEGRVEVEPSRLDEALAALEKANLAPRSPEELLEPPPSSGFLPSAADQNERRNRTREKYLEAEIEQIDDNLSATVQLFRTRKRGALVPEEKVQMTVVLRVEGGRPVSPQIVERIRVKMLHLEPDLPADALTVMDSRGQMYLVAGSSAPAELAHRRAREAELRGAILEQLDWIPNVRVGVKLEPSPSPSPTSVPLAEIATSPVLPSPSPVPAPTPVAMVAVNAPLDVEEAPAVSPMVANAPAVVAVSQEEAAAVLPSPSGEPSSRVNVVVRVPSDYYLRHYEAVRGEQTPTPDDLALFVTRTEDSIRSAVGLVVPREELARVEVERIFVPGPARPVLRTTAPLRLPEVSRTTLTAGALLGVAALLAMMAGARWRSSHRESRTAAGASRSRLRSHSQSQAQSQSRRVRFDAAAPPAERVRDFVRRDPAAAAGVLQSWIGSGGAGGGGGAES